MNPAQRASAPTQTPPVPHFEERITRVFTSAGKRIRKHLPVLLIVACAAVLTLCIYGGVQLFQGMRENALAERLYQYTGSPEALKSESPILLADLDALVKDARGARSERNVLKTVTAYLLEKAYRPAGLGDEDSRILSEIGSTPAAGPSPDVRQALENYTKEGKERFPSDEDMQAWAQNVQKRLQSEETFRSRELKKRTFTPVLSPLVPPGGTTVPSPLVPPGGTTKAAPVSGAIPGQGPAVEADSAFPPRSPQGDAAGAAGPGQESRP